MVVELTITGIKVHQQFDRLVGATGKRSRPDDMGVTEIPVPSRSLSQVLVTIIVTVYFFK